MKYHPLPPPKFSGRLHHPRVGFRVRTVICHSSFQVWDTGGPTIRPYWRCYYIAGGDHLRRRLYLDTEQPYHRRTGDLSQELRCAVLVSQNKRFTGSTPFRRGKQLEFAGDETDVVNIQTSAITRNDGHGWHGWFDSTLRRQNSATCNYL